MTSPSVVYRLGAGWDAPRPLGKHSNWTMLPLSAARTNGLLVCLSSITYTSGHRPGGHASAEVTFLPVAVDLVRVKLLSVKFTNNPFAARRREQCSYGVISVVFPMCPGGETGRRNGLKIRFPATGVRVQVPPRAPPAANSADASDLSANLSARRETGFAELVKFGEPCDIAIPSQALVKRKFRLGRCRD